MERLSILFENVESTKFDLVFSRISNFLHVNIININCFFIYYLKKRRTVPLVKFTVLRKFKVYFILFYNTDFNNNHSVNTPLRM
jgi:hypothetical protein